MKSNKIIRTYIHEVRDCRITGAFMERRQKINTKVKLGIEILGNIIYQNFYIVQRMAHRMVLGMNFLNKTQTTIKCEKILQIWVEYSEDETRFRERNNQG